MVHRTEPQPGLYQIFCKNRRSGELMLNGFKLKVCVFVKLQRITCGSGCGHTGPVMVFMRPVLGLGRVVWDGS